jgi:hypothetical protein
VSSAYVHGSGLVTICLLEFMLSLTAKPDSNKWFEPAKKDNLTECVPEALVQIGTQYEGEDARDTEESQMKSPAMPLHAVKLTERIEQILQREFAADAPRIRPVIASDVISIAGHFYSIT